MTNDADIELTAQVAKAKACLTLPLIAELAHGNCPDCMKFNAHFTRH